MYRESIFILLLLILIIGSCDQPTTFERENVNDPASQNFFPDSLSNVSLNITDNYARISWDEGSRFNDRYQIIKADINDNIYFKEDLDSITTVFIDSTLSPLKGYYQVNQITDTDTIFNLDNRPVFEYDISNFSTTYLENENRVLLEWEYNGYFKTEFLINRSTESGSEYLGSRFNKPFEFEDSQFTSDNIGLNNYTITSRTSVETGSSYSTSIRLPQWSSKKSIPFNLERSRSVFLYPNIYILGRSPRNFKFNIETREWFEIEENARVFSRFYLSPQVISENEIIVFGIDYYEIYNSVLDSWEKNANVPYSKLRFFESVLLDENQILIAGGEASRRVPSRKTYLFDISTRTWSQTQDMLVQRSLHQLINVGSGKIMILGGVPETKKVELYDNELGNWISMPDCPIIPEKAIKFKNGHVLVASKEGSVLFNPTTQTWSESQKFDRSRYATDWQDISLLALPDGNALITGLTGKEPRQIEIRGFDSQIFDYSENKWEQIGNTSGQRFGSVLLFLADNQVISLGALANGGEDTYEFLDISDFLEN